MEVSSKDKTPAFKVKIVSENHHRNQCEGPEWVKWELGLAGFCPGKMGFKTLGPGFGHWKWEKYILLGKQFQYK